MAGSSPTPTGGRRARPGVVVVVAALTLAACSSDDGAGAPVTAADASSPAVTVAVSSTVALESRPVPTVPPSTVAGQTGTTAPGVVNASPTIVPEPPGVSTVSVAPPTTELVGDPQPIPGTTQPPPPTVEAPAPACDRLADFDVAAAVERATGTSATEEWVSVTACRFVAGAVVTEVHFVPLAEVRGDWYVRAGVEPVGEVSGDAVGLTSFLAPGAAATSGYTIAVAGGREGVVVAVRGTDDARYVAGQVAIFANQAA